MRLSKYTKSGHLVIYASVGALLVTLVRGIEPGKCCRSRTIYDPSTWWLIAMVCLGGIIVVISNHVRSTARGAAIGLVASLQLAGTALVAIRRWRTTAGFGAGPDVNLRDVRVLAVALLGISIVAVIVCGRVLLRLVYRPWRGWGDPLVRLTSAAAVVLIIATPVLMGQGRAYSMSATALTAHALMYSIPWGLALWFSVLLCDDAAVTTAVAVVASALPLLGQFMMIWAYHPTTGFALAVIAAAAIIVPRWLLHIRSQRTIAEAASG